MSKEVSQTNILIYQNEQGNIKVDEKNELQRIQQFGITEQFKLSVKEKY